MLKIILRYEWVYWLAAAVATVFLDPARFPFFVALPAFFVLRYGARDRLFANRKTMIPILGILGMVIVSAVVTPDLIFSLRKIAGVVNGIGLYLALGHTADDRPDLPTWLLVIFGILVAGAGALGADIGARIPILFPLFRFFYIFVPFFPNVGRVLNANMIGGTLLFSLLPTLGFAIWLWRTNRISGAIAAAASFGIQTFMLLIMQSRSAILGALAAGFSMMWLLRPTARPVLLRVAIGLMTIIVLLSLPIWPDNIQEQIQTAYFDTLVKGDEGEAGLDSIEARLIIWDRAAELIAEQPLTGYGLNIFRTLANQPEPILPRDQAIPHAHNWALQIMLEMGLPGLVFYIWLLLAICIPLKNGWHQDSNQRVKLVGIGAGIVAFMLFGLLDTVAPGARPDFIFWILLAAGSNQSV